VKVWTRLRAPLSRSVTAALRSVNRRRAWHPEGFLFYDIILADLIVKYTKRDWCCRCDWIMLRGTESRVTHKMNVLYNSGCVTCMREVSASNIDRVPAALSFSVIFLSLELVLGPIVPYKGPRPVSLTYSRFITGDSRYTRLRYPPFRVFMVLFRIHEEHQYPIRGYGRRCRAGSPTCSNYSLRLSENLCWGLLYKLLDELDFASYRLKTSILHEDSEIGL
jgi:hypothetical protein